MDDFPAIQLNWSCRFLSFFGIMAWVFSRFHLSFEFFYMSFGESFKKVLIVCHFWKHLLIKMVFLGVTLFFHKKIKFSFSLAPTQLNWSCRFLSFFGISLEFIKDFAWVLSFLELEFFSKCPKNKPAYTCSVEHDLADRCQHKLYGNFWTFFRLY